MDGVGIPIIERPRPLPGHDTPNPTQHTYTLKCEEPAFRMVIVTVLSHQTTDKTATYAAQSVRI